MADERVIFLEEIQAGSVRVAATGMVTHDLLDGLAGFISRQRKRIDMGLPAGPDINAEAQAEAVAWDHARETMFEASEKRRPKIGHKSGCVKINCAGCGTDFYSTDYR